MNSTDDGLKMCVGEFGPKIQETNKYDPSHKFVANHKQAQGSKGPLGSLT